MEYKKISFDVKHPPKLDPGFIPFGVWANAYRKGAKQPVSIAVERNAGCISVRNTCIYGTPEMEDTDYRYIERYMKFLLWSIGGFRVYLCGCDAIARKLQQDYSETGIRAFDADFFQKLYERPLEIVACTKENFPRKRKIPVPSAVT